jgi:hypothetical protein
MVFELLCSSMENTLTASIRGRDKEHSDHSVACSTVDEFVRRDDKHRRTFF